MTKRGVLNIFSIATGIAVIIFAKYVSNKGNENALANIKKNRTSSDLDIFESYEDVSRQANDILTKENIEHTKQVDAIKSAYNLAEKKVDEILVREKAISQAGYKAVSDAFDVAEAKVSAITANEETMIKNVLKSDDAYTSLKSARKALKKAEESTEKIDKKIENRKEAIRNSIIGARSEEDKATIEEMERLRRRMLDSKGREESIIASRTEEEKAAFVELDNYRRKLRSSDNIRKNIIKNRTDEERSIFEKKNSLLADISNIEEREKLSVNHEQAFVNQLKTMGFGKASVSVIFALPLIPVFLAVYNYISWLFKLVKKM